MEREQRAVKRSRADYDEEAQPSYASRKELNRNGVHCNRNQSPPWREDDKDGHYVFELGENLTRRYKILSKMGEGTFGRVLECWDRKNGAYVAIKVIRNSPKYREAAMIEIDVLETLKRNDRSGTGGCLRLKDWFDYRNHICIVSEKLGPSLYDFLKKNNYRPFTLDHVREFGRQLLSSVAYLHQLSLIHTDLKPENILLVSSRYSKVPDRTSEQNLIRRPMSAEIRLIDFGSATFEKQYHSSIVSTRQYRAPEIILGLGWSYSCDIWSIGCILVELFSGDPLFQTHENLEHLAMMERILGPLPTRIIRKAEKRAQKYFKNERDLDWPESASSDESIRAVERLPRLEELVRSYVGSEATTLASLLRGLLRYETSERLTAKEALRHPFFDTSDRH